MQDIQVLTLINLESESSNLYSDPYFPEWNKCVPEMNCPQEASPQECSPQECPPQECPAGLKYYITLIIYLI